RPASEYPRTTTSPACSPSSAASASSRRASGNAPRWRARVPPLPSAQALPARSPASRAELDGTPVALLQTYEPAEDRVGACYPVEPGDIGAHVLLAPASEEPARPGWSGALLGAFARYVLLGLDRRRVVVDPDVRNDRALARFARLGFEAGPVVTLPEVDLPDVYLPEKRAQLAFLRREVAFPG
ncbi:acetyltransferase, partial [Streptomyces galbus]|nr:acetyltransferase [Streptomyces galbus]